VVRGTIFAGAGLIGGNTITSAGVQSPGYSAGSSGWRIASDGTAEFGVASIRGQLTAAQIDTRGLVIKDASGTPILGSGTALADSYIGGLGNNIIFNGDFMSGTVGMAQSSNNTGVTPHWGVNLDDNWRVRGEGTFFFHLTGYTMPVGQICDFTSSPPGRPDFGYSCVPGQRYEVSCYVQSHRCGAQIFVVWGDAAGNNFSSFGSDPLHNFVPASISGNIGNMARIGAFGIAPPGAVRAIPLIRMNGNGNGDPYLFMSRLYFGEAGANQTQFSRWFPGTGIRQITGANISTFIESASIGQAQIGFAAIGNAQIQNAAVQTLTIAGNAVTVPASFQAGPNADQVVRGGGYQNIRTLGSITTHPYGRGQVLVFIAQRASHSYITGESVSYLAQAKAGVFGGPFVFTQLRIMRNGVTLYDDSASSNQDAVTTTLNPIMFIDTPGAGVACTYSLVFDTSAGNSTLQQHDLLPITTLLLECMR
jgi:hypothetical protein